MAVEYEHVCVAPTAGATDGCESDSWLNNMANIAAIDTPKYELDQMQFCNGK